MKKSTAILIALCALALPAAAQQLEVNSAGGSLRSNGLDPTPGVPFIVGTTSSFSIEVGGNAGSPFILLAGQLANSSVSFPSLNNQFLDLSPSTIGIVGDGIGGFGALPPILFALNGAGSAAFSFPTNAAMDGLTLAFQALVADPTQGPAGLNLTAAPEFSFQNVTTITGDGLAQFAFQNPYPFYGSLYTSIDVSSNGWIRFGGGTALGSDPLPLRSSFLAGTVGGGAISAPVVSVFWAGLDASTATTTIRENVPGQTLVTWQNLLTLITQQTVSFSCLIDVTSGTPVVSFDFTQLPTYTGSNFPIFPILPIGFDQPIIGVTDGGVAGSVASEVDLVSGGATNPTTPGGPVDTIYQDFFGGAFAENWDVEGLVLTFVDLGGGQLSFF